MQTSAQAPLPRQGEGPGEGASVVARLGAQLKRLFGMPDYQRYVAHQHRCHPGEPVLSERDYVRSELERKYAGGGG